MAREPSEDPFTAPPSSSASQGGSSQAGPSRNPNNYVLAAQTYDVRPLARLLRGIGLKHVSTSSLLGLQQAVLTCPGRLFGYATGEELTLQNAVMSVSDAGFEVTVEEVKTFCAVAFVPANLFQNFDYNPPPNGDPTIFEISLDALLQCLNIFGNAGGGGGNINIGRSKRRWAGEGEEEPPLITVVEGGKKVKRTGMRMIWAGNGEPLTVYLQDEGGGGPMTTCELAIYEPEELMNQAFDYDAKALYLIMKSEWFRDALLDLPPSCTKITFVARPRHQETSDDASGATASSNNRRVDRAKLGSFSILAEGDFGSTELDYPNDKELMDRFECREEVRFSYHSAHIALLGRALAQSVKIAIMIEVEGFMSVQVMMPLHDGLEPGQNSGILEFKVGFVRDSAHGRCTLSKKTMRNDRGQ